MGAKFSNNKGFPPRILMLVPHEPELDPRIKWVTQLCAQIGRTDIIGFIYAANNKPSREYEGQIYTERITPVDYPSTSLITYVVKYVKLIIRPRRLLTSAFRRLEQGVYSLSNRYPFLNKVFQAIFRPRRAISSIYTKLTEEILVPYPFLNKVFQAIFRP